MALPDAVRVEFTYTTQEHRSLFGLWVWWFAVGIGAWLVAWAVLLWHERTPWYAGLSATSLAFIWMLIGLRMRRYREPITVTLDSAGFELHGREKQFRLGSWSTKRTWATTPTAMIVGGLPALILPLRAMTPEQREGVRALLEEKCTAGDPLRWTRVAQIATALFALASLAYLALIVADVGS